MKILTSAAQVMITIDNDLGQEVLSYSVDNVQSSLNVTQGLIGLTGLIEQFKNFIKVVDAADKDIKHAVTRPLADHEVPHELRNRATNPIGSSLVIENDINTLITALRGNEFQYNSPATHSAIARVIAALAQAAGIETNEPTEQDGEWVDGHEIKH